MRKYRIFIVVFLFAQIYLSAQSAWSWAYRAGSSGLDQGLAISTGPSGYSYVTGFFHNVGNFGTNQVTSYGGEDIFVARYDASGNCTWVRNAGSANNYPEEGWGVSQDSIGNCYVTGKYCGAATFGNTSVSGTLNAGAFIAKYDTSGNLQWVKNSAPSTSAVESRAITTDHAGNSYIAGNVYGPNQYFGPLVIQSPSGFVVKYDAAGTEVAAYQFGSHGGLYFRSIDADDFGNFYVTGEIQAADSIGTIPVTPTGSNDYFVLKADANGNVIWIDQGIAPASNIWYIGTGITVSKNGNVYVAGHGQGGNEIIGGSYSIHALAGGDNTAFLAAYTSGGNLIWAKQSIGADSISDIEASSVTSNDVGDVVIAGYYFNDFIFGNANLNMSSPQGTNTFVIGLDASGNTFFANNTSGADPGAFALGVSNDTNGNVYVAGQNQLSSNFGSYILSPSGPSDIFIAKINGTTLSVAENENAFHTSVYSDGTSLHIETQDHSGIMELHCYDAQGRLVKSLEFAESSATIDMSDCAAGIYFWKLNDGNGVEESGKILIN
ncbi:MAG TPA: T9SS type A sorting domain-containing protein [Bacteroidia bacterium]|jgi:hypothetical protein|nr:T9SS type A sorting domain-containing protein [Bacteroidia bacterium]